ncbi:hypothetical protein ONS96_005847 [Cadophora gregata f. sp. sojae]|nr:hypothetical protein ONS96_005847 [Cadophora gregata f. sp. sojae]
MDGGDIKKAVEWKHSRVLLPSDYCAVLEVPNRRIVRAELGAALLRYHPSGMLKGVQVKKIDKCGSDPPPAGEHHHHHSQTGLDDCTLAIPSSTAGYDLYSDNKRRQSALFLNNYYTVLH